MNIINVQTTTKPFEPKTFITRELRPPSRRTSLSPHSPRFPIESFDPGHPPHRRIFATGGAAHRPLPIATFDYAFEGYELSLP